MFHIYAQCKADCTAEQILSDFLTLEESLNKLEILHFLLLSLAAEEVKRPILPHSQLNHKAAFLIPANEHDTNYRSINPLKPMEYH